MVSTRRLAAIFAADIVGYSRLMGLDEAGTAQALPEHRSAADPLIAGSLPATQALCTGAKRSM